VGGLALIHYNPLLALGLFALLIGAFLYFAPKILRAMKVKIWLVLKKLNLPATASASVPLPNRLSSRLQPIFEKENVLKETMAWAVPCVSGRGRRVPPNLFGALIATREQPRNIFFVARKGGRPFARPIELEGCVVAHEPKFLSENLSIFPAAGKGARYLFVFPRSDAAMVEQLMNDLRIRISAPIWPIDPAHAEHAVEEVPANRELDRIVTSAAPAGAGVDKNP
jgi:hypothetical protein